MKPTPTREQVGKVAQQLVKGAVKGVKGEADERRGEAGLYDKDGGEAGEEADTRRGA